MMDSDEDDGAGELCGGRAVLLDTWMHAHLATLKTMPVCTKRFKCGDVDPALAGMGPACLVPLLIRWLQQLDRRLSALEEAGEARRRPIPGAPVLEGWYPACDRGHSGQDQSIGE